MKKNRCLMIGMVLMCLWWLGNAWCDVVFMVPNEKDSQPELKFINAAQLATGKFGKAIYFGKESDSTVAFPDQDALKLGKDNFTLSMWLCPKTLETENESIYRRILLKYAGKKGFWVLDVFPNGQLMFSMQDDAGAYASTRSEPGSLAVGKWQHVVVAVDRAAATTDYYVDGVLRGHCQHNASLKGSIDAPGASMQVSTWAGRKYEGLFGAFKVIGRLLTAAEIKQEHTMCKEIFVDVEHTLSERVEVLYRQCLPGGDVQEMWDLAALSSTPKVYPAPSDPFEKFSGDAIRPLMYDGVPYEGKPTRVFAWVGLPAGASASSKVPGMVLVHGGGGTAFRTWVKLWNDRGYAAIAMDTCGHLPLPLDTDAKPWPSHEWSGPAGWGDFGNLDKAVTDQWTYHAVASVILGHSLLRSMEEVDDSRIGLTGISWGGYLTNIVAGVDNRFRFAAPVYGCGFLGESNWRSTFRVMGEEKARKWLTLWDPAQFLCFTKMPVLFCNGTNDTHYLTPAWHRTTQLPRGEVYMSYKVRMPHAHAPAGDPPEITVFADSLLKGKPGLVRLTGFAAMGRQLNCKVAGGVPLKSASVIFTKSTGDWKDRHWETIEATYDRESGDIDGTVPEDATVAYLGATGEDGMFVSTQLVFYGK